MNFLYRVIGTPLGLIMWLCYMVVKNYGVALFLFTMLMRAAMIPITLKQQKSMAKMSLIQPKLQELQKKYANNREKLADEMNKLYQQEGTSPTSGCLPMALQFLLLFGVIDVVYRPLKHILRLPAEVVTLIEEKAFDMGLVSSVGGLNSSQILAVQSMKQNAGPWVDLIGQETVDKVLTLNLQFFGLNLGEIPNMDMFKQIFSLGVFNPIVLVPILAGVSALVVSIISMKTSTANMPEGAGAATGASMKGMMLMMPIFSFMIAFNMPAGVGLYWFYSNLFAIAQTLIINKHYNPKELAEKARIEYEERQEQERLARIEAKKLAKERAKAAGKDEDEELDEAGLSQKERNRRKLAAARKRDAERYGEVYVDVTDDDLK